MQNVGSMYLGVCLPTFVGSVDAVTEMATRAEQVGLDGLFAFDHLLGSGGRVASRPAMELTVAMSQAIATTSTIRVGSLVARAGLRPPAMMAHQFNTLDRISGGRVIAGLGFGDAQSRTEYEVLGLRPTPHAERLAWMRLTATLLGDRGIPVWIGASSLEGRRLAAEVGGWNAWAAAPDTIARVATEFDADRVRVNISWAGSVLVRPDAGAAQALWAQRSDKEAIIWGDPSRIADQLRVRQAAGARWGIVALVEPCAGSIEMLGEVRSLLRRRAR
ncbi:MAG: LLM class flavin-dependent oxidoreductase [Acidimicrobiia bacterium]|nr:LLM class flavin-dependent oxidoreductase [Acidimicrobiia bacterium]